MKIKELIKILEHNGWDKPGCEGVIVSTGTLKKVERSL
jgi:predicted RNA binding protein YcfA (HicA-like mRNA interferase family)